MPEVPNIEETEDIKMIEELFLNKRLFEAALLIDNATAEELLMDLYKSFVLVMLKDLINSFPLE